LTVPGCGGTEPQAGLDNSAARKKPPTAFDDFFIAFQRLYLVDAAAEQAVASAGLVEIRNQGRYYLQHGQRAIQVNIQAGGGDAVCSALARKSI
jgi:hypothetical protein